MTALGGSVASVLAAVREEVEAELERRQKDLDEALAAAGGDAAETGIPPAERSARLAQAREEARERLAHEDWLDSREALERRERWILQAAAEGRRLLREREAAAGGPELLLRLAAEGVARLPGEAFDVILSRDAAARIGEEWCRKLEGQCGKRTVRLAPPENGGPEGGCLVRTSGGRMTFDNSVEARARRFEAAWRSALAELYG